MADAYSEPSQASKMELSMKIIFARNSILDIWDGSECASVLKWSYRDHDSC